MLTYFLQFHILLTAWMLAQCQGCSTGWFGKNCEFLCHCLNFQTCDINGQCPDNGPCEKRFFGPGCQYVDVLQTNTSVSLGQFLRDGDDTTCNPQPNRRVVALSFTEPIPFTWFRLALKDKKNMLNFKTTLNGGQACKNERKFPVSETFVDVSCDRNTMTSIQISGAAVGSLCSFYISGGRNVALRQRAAQSSDSTFLSLDRCRAANAVDGDTSIWHCTQTDNTPLPAWWSMTFSEPNILYKAVIYNRAGYEERLRKFYIETFDKDSTTISVYNKEYRTGLRKYEFNIYTKTPVASLNLTKIQTNLNKDRDGKVLTICEIQTFGDHICPLGTYGYYCEKCPCNVTDTCHPFSGVCTTGCQPGFYGLNCSSRCGHCLHGVCAFYSGECLQCAPGYMGAKCDKECNKDTYGPNCRFNCSKRCNNSCDSITGNCSCPTGFGGALCEECAASWHGPNCEKRCSGFCGDMLCDNLTGNCLTCVGNRVGNFCRDCPDKHYGALCTSMCNVHCLNGTCDQRSGQCSDCEEGHEGPLCWEKKPRIYLYLAPFLPLYILFFACVLGCSERIDVEEEDEDVALQQANAM